MIAGGIRLPFKSLHLAELGTKGPDTFKGVFVIPPPWLPDSKVEIWPVGRRVIGRGRVHQPGDLRIRQWSTSIVFRFHSDDGVIASKIWSFGLIACSHFEFRSPELKDLELVVVLVAIYPAKIPFGTQDELRVAQVSILR